MWKKFIFRLLAEVPLTQRWRVEWLALCDLKESYDHCYVMWKIDLYKIKIWLMWYGTKLKSQDNNHEMIFFSLLGCSNLYMLSVTWYFKRGYTGSYNEVMWPYNPLKENTECGLTYFIQAEEGTTSGKHIIREGVIWRETVNIDECTCNFYLT